MKQGRILKGELFKGQLHSICKNAQGRTFKGEFSTGEYEGEFHSKGESLRENHLWENGILPGEYLRENKGE